MACFGLRVCRPENPFEVSVPRAEVPRAPPRPTAATSEGSRGGKALPEGAFRNLLARHTLLAISSGWDDANATIYSNLVDYLGERHVGALDRAFEALATRAPKGWRPTGPDDPLLVEASRRWGA